MANIKVKELREILKQNQKDNIKVAEYNGLQIENKTISHHNRETNSYQIYI